MSSEYLKVIVREEVQTVVEATFGDMQNTVVEYREEVDTLRKPELKSHKIGK